MKITEVVKLLKTMEKDHGDVEVYCINNDGPGYLWESCVLTPEYVKYNSTINGDNFSITEEHIMIGESL